MDAGFVSLLNQPLMDTQGLGLITKVILSTMLFGNMNTVVKLRKDC
jgi:hypothetical protein